MLVMLPHQCVSDKLSLIIPQLTVLSDNVPWPTPTKASHGSRPHMLLLRQPYAHIYCPWTGVTRGSVATATLKTAAQRPQKQRPHVLPAHSRQLSIPMLPVLANMHMPTTGPVCQASLEPAPRFCLVCRPQRQPPGCSKPSPLHPNTTSTPGQPRSPARRQLQHAHCVTPAAAQLPQSPSSHPVPIFKP